MATQDPRKQAMYEQAGKQALKALSSPEGAEMVANDAVANGPAQAIVNALQGVERVIVQAAGGVTRISWQLASMEALIDVLARDELR
jgi:hypothetical protein